MAYGAPFIVALVYTFVETRERGHIYGPADVRSFFGFLVNRLSDVEISFGAGCQWNGRSLGWCSATYQPGMYLVRKSTPCVLMIS